MRATVFGLEKYLINALFLSFILCSSCKNKISADLLIYAPKIYQCNESFDICEAMVISKGRIIATGTFNELKKKYSVEKEVKFDYPIYPGFIDAHAHFLGLGQMEQILDLSKVNGLATMAEQVLNYAKTTESYWIQGRGWDQNKWEYEGQINNARLNIFLPDRPVLLKRVDGHAALANAKALAIAGIDEHTMVEGGEIDLFNGKPTGLLLDNAVDLMSKVIDKPSAASYEEALALAQKQAFANGITCMSDAGLDLNQILLIDSLQKQKKLLIKLYLMANPTNENFEYFKEKGVISKSNLQISSFKIYADGALGSRGALLKKPYCDRANYYGLWLTPLSDIDLLCKQIYDMGFQSNTHCIGDSAVAAVLRIYGKYLQKPNDRMWRIEHAQVVSPRDMSLFDKFSVIPSVQPTHATSDMMWASKRLCPERMEGAYSYASLLKNANFLALGTDAPVESLSPIGTFYAAVYRQTLDNNPPTGYILSEALTPQEALWGITLWAAKANKMDHNIGSLSVGKFADFVVLDKDLINDRYVQKTKVLTTFLNGVKVF